MPKLFARQTALSNIGGRIDYISNPKRQENILAVHDGADAAYWNQLAKECKLSSKYIDPKQNKKSVQGRELMFQLSNSLIQRLPAETITKIIADTFEQKYNRPCVVALHFNKGKKSLHAHVIYSERELLKEPNEKIAQRALFFDENGNRQYKKAAILNEDGELRPGCKIVKKGEIYERRLFGAVDPKFSSKSWLKECKSEWLLSLRNNELRGDVLINEFDHSTGEIPQQYIGNKVEHASPETAEQIRELNKTIQEYNTFVANGDIPTNIATENKKRFFRWPHKQRLYTLMQTIEKIKAIFGIKQTAENKLPEPEKKLSLDEQLAGVDARKEEQGTNTLGKEKMLSNGDFGR